MLPPPHASNSRLTTGFAQLMHKLPPSIALYKKICYSKKKQKPNIWKG